MLCETRLSPRDLDIDYKIDMFADIVRHDETTRNESRSFHGLAAYVNHLHLCEIHKQRNEGFESLYMCIHKKGDPQPIHLKCSKKTLMKVLKTSML